MTALTQPPLSAPIQGDRGISDSWQVYLTRLGAFASGATNPQTIDNGSGETCRVLQVGAILLYSYTGLGGVTFSFNGNAFTIPASTTPTTTKSSEILGV
jgi:hypothetical protein